MKKMKVIAHYNCILSFALFFVKLVSLDGFTAVALTRSHFGKDRPHPIQIRQDPSRTLLDGTYLPRLSTVIYSQTSRSGFSTLSVPEEARFLIRTGTSWVIFGGIVTGLSLSSHVAATHRWLSINAGTWDAISIATPLLLVSSCVFYLLMVFGSSEPRLILDSMGGQEIQDVRLVKALASIYDKADLALNEDDSTQHQTLPRLFVVPSKEPNAFATGTIENGAVAVTEGLLDVLNQKEIQAVLAHEVGHIQNRDTEANTQIAAMLAALGFIIDSGGFLLDVTRGSSSRSFDSNSENDNDDDNDKRIDLHTVGFVLYVSGAVTYCLGTLLRLASSRTAEYDADAFAKSIGEGPNLASALRKIQSVSKGPDRSIRPAREDASALGAMNGAYVHAYIHNPPSRDSPLITLGGLLQTHPSIEQRIQKLTEE